MTDQKTDREIRAEMEKENDPRVDLAVERTELALERTLLAWVRTLLSMIGGGFVIDRAMEALHKARLETGEAILKNGHFAGMILTGMGTLLMILVAFFYSNRASQLARMKGSKKSLLAPSILLSIFTVVIGMILLYFIWIS